MGARAKRTVWRWKPVAPPEAKRKAKKNWLVLAGRWLWRVGVKALDAAWDALFYAELVKKVEPGKVERDVENKRWQWPPNGGVY